ncbi:MAG: ABC transporter substrate-binding protein [Candidatus Hermodarchaeota archaeon]
MHRKEIKEIIVISIFSTSLIIFGISFFAFIMHNRNGPWIRIALPSVYYGTPFLAKDVDPQYSWDSSSFEFSAHIWEGLFAINFFDPQFGLVPRLATSLGTYSPDGKELTIPLRQGIKFHDGTPFNADAVKFSFDRLAYLMNVSGILPLTCYYQIPTILHSLYEWPDGTPIINHTEIIDTYTVKFLLNRPFGSFRYLLAFPGSYILSPHSTPSDDYIDPSTAGPDTCVGTGPFILINIDSYEVRFHDYEDYHLGKSEIDSLVFCKILDDKKRKDAVLDGDIDIIIEKLYSWDDELEKDDNIVVFKDYPSWIFSYIRIFNQNINCTWRKAISFAINYSRIINSLTNNLSFRLNGILAPNIFGYDPTIIAIDYNLTYAREVMSNMGFGNVSWIDSQWRAAEFASWNFSYRYKSNSEIALYEFLRDNLDQIGINLTEGTESYQEWLEKYMHQIWSFDRFTWFNNQNFVLFNWYPDYSAAYNTLYAFFSSNGFLSGLFNIITDPWIEQKLEQASQEFNDTARATIYSEVQRYNNKEFFPLIYLYHHPLQYLHDIHLISIPYNPTGLFYAYPIEFE